MKNPMRAFIEWFESIPLMHSMCLAHIYRICTTENTEDMVLPPEISLEKFKLSFVRTDFPVRIAARMLTVVNVIDLIVLNHRELILGNPSLFPMNFNKEENIELLAEHQWGRTCESWKVLRNYALSDTYLGAWAKAVIHTSTGPNH